MPSVETIAIRLADEGVPLRAIARATNTPSDQLRSQLREAHDDGRLLELPKEDWPPGFPRDQRALRLSRMGIRNPEAVTLAAGYVFGLTATEVSLLMTLIRSPDVPRERIGMAPRTIDVHVCHIRKALAPFGIVVETLWGYGYQLSEPHRRKVMEMILSRAQGASDTAPPA